MNGVVGRWGTRAITVFIVLLAAIFAATALFFVWPSSDAAPRRADAVIVLSGGHGDRLPKALRLMQSNVAPVLVISNGDRKGWRAANAVCWGNTEYAVQCPFPNPETTRGEAELVARLAAQHGWNKVVVITSSYHVTRAELLVKRCMTAKHATVDVVASVPHDPFWTSVRHVVHEWLGLLDSWTLRRSC